jgi:acetylornithine deacetylase/succinyl-diaminopimelate desuccinylase-like protein
MTRDSKDVLDRVEREKESYLGELQDYLRIPSISTDPGYHAEVLRCAGYLVDRLTSAGLQAETIETAGNPLVFAEWTGKPGKPTVVFYGHYDVQPVDPIEEWRNPPFEPTIERDAERGDRLVARGATDDKGQSFAHVKAVAAMLAERGELPVNVKFIVEGEEEMGGEAIESFVREDAGRRLAGDCVVISDSSMYAPGQPSLIYGMKGLCYMEIRVQGPSHDLHSGTFGGAVANPLNALAQIIARLQDPETGKVLIPGFYDRVLPLAEWEREEFAALPFDEAAYMRELGVSELHGEQGYTTRERAWARPTCDVNGIFGGYQGKGAKTILPAWGGAKVSMRLVPDQDPEEIARLFTEHVTAVAPAGVKVEVSSVHGADPVLIEAEGPVVEAALDAMQDVWGARPVRVREGGSIPIVSTFAQVLEVPVLLMGFGLDDDRLHSPNEKLNLESFYGGIRSVVRLLDRLGELPAGAGR